MALLFFFGGVSMETIKFAILVIKKDTNRICELRSCDLTFGFWLCYDFAKAEINWLGGKKYAA